MADASILGMCATAFAAVFLLLGFLAGVIRLITTALPGRSEQGDPAVAGAIASAVTALYPGARVTRIEEES